MSLEVGHKSHGATTKTWKKSSHTLVAEAHRSEAAAHA